MDFIAVDMLSTPSGSVLDRNGPILRASSPSTSREKFSSVLQTVRGEEGRNNSRETAGVPSSDKTDDRLHTKETKGLNGSSSKTERSDNVSARATNEERASDGEGKTVESAKGELDSPSRQSNDSSGLERQVPALFAPVIVVQAGIDATDQAEIDLNKEPHISQSGKELAEGAATSSVVSPRFAASATPVRERTDEDSAEGHMGAPSLGGKSQSHDTLVNQKAAESQGTRIVAQQPNVVINASGVKATNPDESRPISPESRPETRLSSDDFVAHPTAQAHLVTVLPDGPSEVAKVASTHHEAITSSAALHDQVQLYAQSPKEHGITSPRMQALVPAGQELSLGSTEHFSEWSSEHDSRQQGNPEAQVPKTAVGDLQALNGRGVESFAVSAQGQASSASTTPAPASFTTHAQTATPAHDLTQQPIGSMIRSVVVDVAQPDLGHVNVRVALMNDSVHAHFSADRAEIGQFLINGQDRLQTTLQASGLDMGQFRVDIDRQGSGRSFQQGSFQEQGRSWGQDAQGMSWEQSRDRQDDARPSLHGRLNLVA